MSYLTTGYMEENIYPLIDSYSLNAYKIAVENKYRFFSFGDAMYIEKNNEN